MEKKCGYIKYFWIGIISKLIMTLGGEEQKSLIEITVRQLKYFRYIKIHSFMLNGVLDRRAQGKRARI